MADSLFLAKRSIFVKTYSKVRPLRKFDSRVKPNVTSGATPTGKPLPFLQPANSIAPTLAPANSPSSDVSSSETTDVEMISDRAEKHLNTEEEEEETFVTLTPTSKKTSKKHGSKKKSYSPLKNISNIMKMMSPSKTAPKPVSPVMWTCTNFRPQGRLASIQESDQESLSDNDEECTNVAKDELQGTTSNRKSERMNNIPKGRLHTKKLEIQDIGTGARRISSLSQKRSKDSPMIVEGRGLYASSYGSTTVGDGSRSTQLYESQTDEFSTVTYTRQSGEASDESTIVISDDNDSTAIDTLKEEEFSEIEIPRDFSAMPKKSSSTWHNRKPTVKTKNSTLVDGLTALNIQEYGPMQEISDIKEETSRADLDANKKTSTPFSRGRNTMLHQRFLPDVSSIEGDACAMPTIDDMQSLTSTMLADKIKYSTTQKLAELRPVSASSKTKGPPPRSVYSISASSDENLPTPLGIRGKKAYTIERASPRMSPRLSFSQYPKAANKITTNQKKASVVSTGNKSRNDSSSVTKHVKFLLSNKAYETLPEPGPNMSLSIVNLPELSPSSSILKKRERMSGEPTPSVAMKTKDTENHSLKQEKKQSARKRMTSTPQRHSRRTKGAHMLELSFDVSSVDLPSCNADDLFTQPSNQTESKTTAVVSIPGIDEDLTITAAVCNTQELMDFEPIPMQVSTSINSQPLHPSEVIQEDIKPANLESLLSNNAAKQQEALAIQRARSNHKAIQHPVPATHRCHQVAQHPSIAIPEQNARQQAKHPIRATDKYFHRVQEAKKSLCYSQATPNMQTSHQKAESPVQSTQHPLNGTQDEGNPQDLHPVSGADDLCCPVNGPHEVNNQPEAAHPAPNQDDQCLPQGAQHPFSDTHDHQLRPRNTQHLTLEVVGTKKTQQPIHATPKSQLKRTSPNGDLPGRPNKKKFLKKDLSDDIKELLPQTCDHATQKDFPRQPKKLEYVDKAVGLPECIISRLGPTPYRPAKFIQYINNVMDYDEMKKLPQDIIETIPDAVFF